jgi:hypothetical protein
MIPSPSRRVNQPIGTGCSSKAAYADDGLVPHGRARRVDSNGIRCLQGGSASPQPIPKPIETFLWDMRRQERAACPFFGSSRTAGAEAKGSEPGRMCGPDSLFRNLSRSPFFFAAEAGVRARGPHEPVITSRRPRTPAGQDKNGLASERRRSPDCP